MPRGQRIGLSKSDLSSEVGKALLNLLDSVVADGALSDDEIREFATWLNRTSSTTDLPGLHFLREEVAGVLADGTVSDGERRLLQTAILRVLPVTERERAKARIADRTAAEREAERARWTAEQNAPTDAQLEYIRGLGGTCPAGVTRGEASQIIDRLLANRPTVRQRMVLRFWNRADLMLAGVDGVSAWLDEWYRDDTDRLEAWETWKREAKDEGGGSSALIDQVPEGGGFTYLSRVKAAREGLIDKARANSKREGRMILIVLGVVTLLAFATVGLMRLWIYLK